MKLEPEDPWGMPNFAQEKNTSGKGQIEQIMRSSACRAQAPQSDNATGLWCAACRDWTSSPQIHWQPCLGSLIFALIRLLLLLNSRENGRVIQRSNTGTWTSHGGGRQSPRFDVSRIWYYLQVDVTRNKMTGTAVLLFLHCPF